MHSIFSHFISPFSAAAAASSMTVQSERWVAVAVALLATD
jgi:hypothetical protein